MASLPQIIQVRYGERLFIHLPGGADGQPAGRLIAVIEPGAEGLVLRTRAASTRVRGEEEALKLLALPRYFDRTRRPADPDTSAEQDQT
jgi:hypothetical protein